MKSRVIPVACLACLLLPATVYGQSRETTPSSPTVFAQLFPHPTGHNGYEEIVSAGDKIRRNTALDAAEKPEATLTQKRAALADPACRDALSLLRLGLAKPIQSPRANSYLPPANGFPDHQSLRRLGRLLKVEQYVYLAEGRSSAAIASLGDALALSDAIRNENFLSSLASDSVDQTCLYAFSFHIQQWTLPDCNRVLRLIQERLVASPDPGAAMLRGELFLLNSYLDKTLETLEKNEGVGILERQVGPEEASDIQEQWRALGTDPSVRRAAYAEIKRRISDAFELAITKDPFASGAFPATLPSAKTRSLADSLVQAGTMNLPMMRQILSPRQAELRLLAVHAAIRRYQWENNCLPATLADLNMEDLITDPYTKAPFLYIKNIERTYTLESARRREGMDAHKSALRLPPSSDVWR